MIEEKLDASSHNVEGLKPEIHVIKERLTEQKLKKEQLNQEYILLKDKQSAIETTQAQQNSKYSIDGVEEILEEIT